VSKNNTISTPRAIDEKDFGCSSVVMIGSGLLNSGAATSAIGEDVIFIGAEV
jgi:hypothetical protein